MGSSGRCPGYVDLYIHQFVGSEALMKMETDRVVQAREAGERGVGPPGPGIVVDGEVSQRDVVDCWRGIEDVVVGEQDCGQSVQPAVG